MKTIFSVLPALFFGVLLNVFAQTDTFHYEIDVTDPADDLFHVTGYPAGLSPADSVYSFVAFAPGVHQVLNYGRFVQSFKAFDAMGEPIAVRKDSINDWIISDPSRVHKIVYETEDTFDSEVKGVVYPMSGTGIEAEYIVINNFGVLGYFREHRSSPIRLTVRHNPAWIVGTALQQYDDGSFLADSYYQLADSPIIIGNLTRAKKQVGDIAVEAFVFSPDSQITADTVMSIAGPMLDAAYAFAGFSPVDRYTFLMYFYADEDIQRNPSFVGAGALEHSFSSTYALPAKPQMVSHFLGNVIAHEFMHILTPLHLRSEIIAEWDYSRPTLEDHHLWLYEGVTEWVAHIMQLRSGVISVEEYLKRISGKIESSDHYGNQYSLTRLSSEWFTEEGNKKYGNIYQLGALTAQALDIRLLQLSEGKRGLREVYVDLIKKYGRDKPFENNTFFQELVETTHPEIDDFINKHIIGNEPLDYIGDFRSLGVRYIPERPSGNTAPVFGIQLGSKDGKKLFAAGFSKEHEPFGLLEGDVIETIFDRELTLASSDSILNIKNQMNPGDTYSIEITRDGKKIKLTGKLFRRMDYHILEVDENSSASEKKLREAWLKNLNKK